jgi:hypothetical protein
MRIIIFTTFKVPIIILLAICIALLFLFAVHFGPLLFASIGWNGYVSIGWNG